MNRIYKKYSIPSYEDLRGIVIHLKMGDRYERIIQSSFDDLRKSALFNRIVSLSAARTGGYKRKSTQ